MFYRLLADAVVLAHLGFIAFVAIGGVLAWRWPRLVWLHLPAAGYALGIVTVGFTCPLTPLEKHLRHLAGQAGYPGRFVAHYLAGVVYPGRLIGLARAGVVALVLAGYLGLAVRHHRGARDRPA
jgi:Protein of Unknown function (DUF2784)